MAALLVFRDLFAYDDCSLGWLRVYRLEDNGVIALVLEPSDNPGRSAVNAAEGLVDDLQRAFGGLGQLRTFVRFVDDPRGEGWTELLAQEDGMDFTRRTVEEVEALIGAGLPESELVDATCGHLGGERHPLLALIPPPEEPRNPFDDLCVVAVADLPWPHNPARCPWKNRFEQVGTWYPAGRHPHPAVGAHWFLTVSEQDLAACPYHDADWSRVAQVSVDVLRSLTKGTAIDDPISAAEQALGDSPEGAWCVSLFSDPIVWRPDQPRVTNGQHRACALKASGAPLCVVDADGAYVQEPVVTDPARRAASDIAAFWARRAGS